MEPLAHGDRIAVLTSGGDAPGMNAAVRAVVRIGTGLGFEVLGVRWGYQGLIDEDVVVLRPRDVDGASRRGGTLLGSSRCAAFRTEPGRARAAEFLRRSAIRGVVVVGGDGSLTGAHHLAQERDHTGERFRVIGVPASIDNDIGFTTSCIGTDTALNTIMEACDRIADTASAHARTFLVEVMGRECGYLAITAAVACEADGVLFREQEQDEAHLVEKLVNITRHAYDPEVGKHSVLVIKSEGVPISTARLKEGLDARLGEDGVPVETRVSVLGHVVRGGAPTAFDRLLAGRLAHAAVRAIQRGRTDAMAAWNALVPPGCHPEVFDLDPYVTLWPLEEVLAETHRLVDGTSDRTRFRLRLISEIEPILAD